MAPRNTRRNRTKGKVLDVRSSRQGKLFDSLMVKGPLTLVFARLEGCGPCERFKKEVWTPLTKLKNRGVNLASIESSAMGNTSLAPYTPQQYPTIMLVGPDRRPATFLDENGEKTNSMPRKNTLSEDRATLSALVQGTSGNRVNGTRSFRNTAVTVPRTVTNLPIGRNSVARQSMASEGLPVSQASMLSQSKPASPYTNEENEIPSMVNEAKSTRSSSSMGASAAASETMVAPVSAATNEATSEAMVAPVSAATNEATSEAMVAPVSAATSEATSAAANEDMATAMATPVNEAMATPVNEARNRTPNKANVANVSEVPTVRRSFVPNVASDLLATQSGLKTGTATVLTSEHKNPKGGRLINAIRRQTASLNVILGSRKTTKAKTRRPRSKIGPGAK